MSLSFVLYLFSCLHALIFFCKLFLIPSLLLDTILFLVIFLFFVNFCSDVIERRRKYSTISSATHWPAQVNYVDFFLSFACLFFSWRRCRERCVFNKPLFPTNQNNTTIQSITKRFAVHPLLSLSLCVFVCICIWCVMIIYLRTMKLFALKRMTHNNGPIHTDGWYQYWHK